MTHLTELLPGSSSRHVASSSLQTGLACFKAYDIRGRVPDELNEDIAWRIGRSLADCLKPRTIVVGGDIRLTSASIKQALIAGLRAAGVNVIDIGLCGTEQVYFATVSLNTDGGVMVTASHNPIDYNGMKLVRKASEPLAGDTGLQEVAQRVATVFTASPFTNGTPAENVPTGSLNYVSHLEPYIDHLLSYLDLGQLKPLKLVINAGNGVAGPVLDAIERRFQAAAVPVTLIKIHHTPDGHFPNGIPNPLLPDNRHATMQAVIAHQADMGIAWDGDFDRCFFFDERGHFVESYYIVGLLADLFLSRTPDARIVYDPRLIWNTLDIVNNKGGRPVLVKAGHTFMKTAMRAVDAVYGGEMSAHHYFRDFAYCDSGMIPWLLVIGLLSEKNQTLSSLVAERIRQFPASGEINRTVNQPEATLARITAIYGKEAIATDTTDGISFEFTDWRFNLRLSNTEPLIRLNVESRGDVALMQQKTADILQHLDAQG